MYLELTPSILDKKNFPSGMFQVCPKDCVLAQWSNWSGCKWEWIKDGYTQRAARKSRTRTITKREVGNGVSCDFFSLEESDACLADYDHDLVSILRGNVYIVVQKFPQIVKGPYRDLQLAKMELKKVAKNGYERMILEIKNGVLQAEYGQVHKINGRKQLLVNGFDQKWKNWPDILEMIKVARKHLVKKFWKLK